MKAMWERGRDQDTAAEEYSNNNESELQQYRPGPRGGGDNSREADRGGRGDRLLRRSKVVTVQYPR